MLKLWTSFVVVGVLLVTGCNQSETSSEGASSNLTANGSDDADTSKTVEEVKGGRFGKVGDVYEFGEGYGDTAGEAINSAMSVIIMKINGASVSVGQNSGTSTATLGQTIENDDDDEGFDFPLGKDPENNLERVNAALSTAAFTNKVQVSSKGTLSRVEVLNLYPPERTKNGSNDDDDGTSRLWRAEIKAATLKYTPPDSSKLPRISVHNTESSNSSFAIGDGSVSLSDISSDITQILQAGIQKSGYFTVLSREHYHAINDEIELIVNGVTEQSAKERTGNILASDIAIIPIIRTLDYGKKTRSAGSSGKSLEWYSGRIEIEFFAMNVVTREVITTETYSRAFPSTEPTTLNRGLNGRPAVNKAIEDFTQAFLNDFLNVAAPLAVMRVNGNSVVISGGDDRVSQGDTFTVYLLGEEIIDPRTDTSLGFEDQEIGTVAVTRVTKQLSYGELNNTASADISKFEPGKLILQPLEVVEQKPESAAQTYQTSTPKPAQNVTQTAPSTGQTIPPKAADPASAPVEISRSSEGKTKAKDDDW